MKPISIFLSLFLITCFCQAQYSQEKLTEILTGGNSKAWSVKATNGASTEKSYTFNKNLTVAIAKGEGTQTEKWVLSSADNIRWFVTIGSQKRELIVSYDKAGTQFLKLTSQAGDKASIYSEMLLYPLK